jgi:hypothetical protein
LKSAKLSSSLTLFGSSSAVDAFFFFGGKRKKKKMASTNPPPAIPPVRVLIAGDVRGNFDALYARVRAVNAKAGPFDALFCVGQFFADDDDDGEEFFLFPLAALLLLKPRPRSALTLQTPSSISSHLPSTQLPKAK